MSKFIGQLAGDVKSKASTDTDILALLGITGLSALTVDNSGRSGSISSIIVAGKHYALSDVLTAIGEKLTSGDAVGLTVKLSGTSTITADKTFAQMKAAPLLNMSWNGNPASQISYTKSGSNITAVVAKFLAFGETLTVTTMTINSSGITKTSAEYVLTAPTTT